MAKDMSYLKDKPIAVLGAGGVGKTIAADCALGGAKVRLWEQPAFAKNLENIDRTGIKLIGNQFSRYGFYRAGTGYLELATTDLAEAVKGAGLIIITTIAIVHEKIFRDLMPLLEDGQVIHLIPDNLGTFEFHKVAREYGLKKDVIVGAWYTSPYGSRITKRGGITLNESKVEYRVTYIRGAALPATDTDDFLESSKYIPAFDAITQGDGPIKGDTVIDVNLSNVNPVIHVPGTVLGVSTMENFDTVLDHDKKDYSLYGFALCPSIARVQVKFWHEEIDLAEAVGCGITPVPDKDFFSRTTMLGKEYYGPDFAVPFEEKYENFYGDGPFDLENRYITEDVPNGCFFIHQLGQKFGVKTPTVDALCLLANEMIGRDLIADSKWTLEHLEIAHMSKEQLNDYVRNGNFVPAE
ncbi:MAG: NAD/NADP octopine/nopaline dehydrogenase family protein [Pseudoramibacter sp.]